MQPSECAPVAGAGVGWLAICYSFRELQSARVGGPEGVTPCPLPTREWTGLSPGPETTPPSAPASSTRRCLAPCSAPRGAFVDSDAEEAHPSWVV